MWPTVISLHVFVQFLSQGSNVNTVIARTKDAINVVNSVSDSSFLVYGLSDGDGGTNKRKAPLPFIPSQEER
jgi:hypothetical protein